jgi:hypothetical protein
MRSTGGSSYHVMSSGERGGPEKNKRFRIIAFSTNVSDDHNVLQKRHIQQIHRSNLKPPQDGRNARSIKYGEEVNSLCLIKHLKHEKER